MQRRVEGLLQEHLDRSLLTSEKVEEKSIGQVEDVGLDEHRDSFMDGSFMEKVLQRRGLQMRNMQRAFLVGILYCTYLMVSFS